MVVAAALAALAMTANVKLECPDAYTFAAESQTYTGDPDHGAVFVYGSRRIILRNDVCDMVSRLATTDWTHPPALYGFSGWTVFTLAHELAHAAGVVDEAAADCAAARTYRSVAGQLGIPAPFVQRLMIESAAVDGYSPAATAGCWPRLMDARAA